MHKNSILDEIDCVTGTAEPYRAPDAPTKGQADDDGPIVIHPNAAHLRWHPPRARAERVTEEELASTYRAVLGHGPCTLNKIRTATGIDVNTTRVALLLLIKAGKVLSRSGDKPGASGWRQPALYWVSKRRGKR